MSEGSRDLEALRRQYPDYKHRYAGNDRDRSDWRLWHVPDGRSVYCPHDRGHWDVEDAYREDLPEWEPPFDTDLPGIGACQGGMLHHDWRTVVQEHHGLFTVPYAGSLYRQGVWLCDEDAVICTRCGRAASGLRAAFEEWRTAETERRRLARIDAEALAFAEEQGIALR